MQTSVKLNWPQLQTEVKKKKHQEEVCADYHHRLTAAAPGPQEVSLNMNDKRCVFAAALDLSALTQDQPGPFEKLVLFVKANKWLNEQANLDIFFNCWLFLSKFWRTVVLKQNPTPGRAVILNTIRDVMIFSTRPAALRQRPDCTYDDIQYNSEILIEMPVWDISSLDANAEKNKKQKKLIFLEICLQLINQ